MQVWVFEPSQLIRVILSRPPEEVNRQRDEIVTELSNATQSRVVVDEIRYHVDSSGHIRREWCDMYLHVVDTKTQTITLVPQVLKAIDAKYDLLKEYYSGFAIENVVVSITHYSLFIIIYQVNKSIIFFYSRRMEQYKKNHLTQHQQHSLHYQLYYQLVPLL